MHPHNKMSNDKLSLCAARRLTEWLSPIQTSVLGLLPSHLLTHTSQRILGTYNFQSQELFLLSIPKIGTEMGGKRHLNMLLPFTWNNLKLNKLVSGNAFKGMLNDLKVESSGCRYSAWYILFMIMVSLNKYLLGFFWGIFDVSSFIIFTCHILSLDVWPLIICLKLW